MLLLTGTSHLLRVVTGANGADVRVYAEWLENNGGTITPGSQGTAAITTATTTTIVPSPTTGKQRNITGLSATNIHATVATRVRVEHFDGTTAASLMSVMLLPGENLTLTETGAWQHRDALGGAEYKYVLPPRTGIMAPTGVLAESYPRTLVTEYDANMFTSNSPFSQSVILTAGMVVTNCVFMSSDTGATSPTNYQAGIYNSEYSLEAYSADQLTTPWPANTLKSIPLLSPYLVPKTDLYFITLYMTATTPVKLRGMNHSMYELQGGSRSAYGANITSFIPGQMNSWIYRPLAYGWSMWCGVS